MRAPPYLATSPVRYENANVQLLEGDVESVFDRAAHHAWPHTIADRQQGVLVSKITAYVLRQELANKIIIINRPFDVLLWTFSI